MYRGVIGNKSKKVKNVVERTLVKRFAEAIGDLHPIYTDEEYGKRSRYGRNIAPPTFPRVLDYGVVEGLKLPTKGLIHGEQIYHYERPLLVGEELYCHAEIMDYYEKEGRNGLMGFLAVKRYGEDLQGHLIFTEESKTIITEAVRKAMKL
ncbi:MaoC family dehydratase N-terminal domain-containing protein [Calidifontibacillus erzurumensis]|uniref:MaoC family dehydratase N-terminal domain-containing protein n=1 Tax=Calidifontibacillus erzurumensis TaxID=2741433 RepID=A0A8J8KC44_9BACI|nr:MaoC family dehydratase N-terminal domain-containing protein [Calidifontibacillus erzurumensis]NSL51683.1 MaoC family dehydratase N-terminal domain-containing protein [Calidifontibacillus erzurumensis]